MNVALIEDDRVQADYLLDAARQQGWQASHFADPASFFRAAPSLKHELLAVDWNLPQMNGGQIISCARQLFGAGLPIIVLTGDLSEAVALEALGLDADDFMHKPVSGQLFCARLAAVYRRYKRDKIQEDLFVAPPYKLLRSARALLLNDQALTLTPREFDLAWLLFSNTERFLSRAELMAGVWGVATDLNSHTLAQHMHSLRRKLDLAGHGWALRSVYGAGYRMVAPTANAATVSTGNASINEVQNPTRP